ncbi:hypothetical protein P7K49_006722, partial [Saguinus oedipus]
MPQLSGGGGGGGGDPELCATDEMIPFKDEGDPQKEKIFAEISHPEEEGDLADIKSSLVNESEIIPASNGHEFREAWRAPGSPAEGGAVPTTAEPGRAPGLRGRCGAQSLRPPVLQRLGYTLAAFSRFSGPLQKIAPGGLFEDKSRAG